MTSGPRDHFLFLTEQTRNIEWPSNTEAAMAWVKDAAATAGFLAFIVGAFGLADAMQAAFAAI